MKKTILPMAGLTAALLATAGTAVYAAGPQDQTQARPAAGMTRADAVAKANEMWTAMDANKDGAINAADREARRSQMFDRMDTNKDGTISREEFNTAHPQQAGKGAGMDGHDHSAMQHGDMQHGGMKQGDAAPHRHHRAAGYRGGGMKMGMMLLRMADANKDGSVTRAEFDAALNSHLDKVDANKDGTISATEQQAAHAEMKKQMQAARGAKQ